MGALMSTNAVQIIEEEAEVKAFQESLSDRMSRGPLPLTEALRYAAQIATTLRDLHQQGLVYGAVSSQLIVLDAKGAGLRNTAGLKRLGDPRVDVAAFGAVLAELMRGTEGAERLRTEVRALANRCGTELPEMQQVLITLRIISLETRQESINARRGPRPVLVRRAAKQASPDFFAFMDARLRTALAWRPAIHFPAFHFSSSK